LPDGTHNFKQKISILVHFRGSYKGSCLVYFMSIWSIFLPLGIFCGHLVCYVVIWYYVPRKIWQPCDPNVTWYSNLF
jgi:hypothetical protein